MSQLNSKVAFIHLLLYMAVLKLSDQIQDNLLSELLHQGKLTSRYCLVKILTFEW